MISVTRLNISETPQQPSIPIANPNTGEPLRLIATCTLSWRVGGGNLQHSPPGGFFLQPSDIAKPIPLARGLRMLRIAEISIPKPGSRPQLGIHRNLQIIEQIILGIHLAEDPNTMDPLDPKGIIRWLETSPDAPSTIIKRARSLEQARIGLPFLIGCPPPNADTLLESHGILSDDKNLRIIVRASDVARRTHNLSWDDLLVDKGQANFTSRIQEISRTP